MKIYENGKNTLIQKLLTLHLSNDFWPKIAVDFAAEWTCEDIEMKNDKL